METKELNELFQSLCRELDVPRGRLAQEYQELIAELVARRCVARGKALPIFTKPVFISSRQVQRFQTAVDTILDCQEKVIDLYSSDYHFRPLYELTDNEKPLVVQKHRLRRHIHFSRLDALLTPNSFRFLEFNCDSPGGAFFADIQAELLMNFSVLREMSKRVTFRLPDYRSMVLDTLIRAWVDYGGTAKPSIAVIGDPDVANVEEFLLFADYFQRNGYESFFTDPWSLEYDGTVLRSEGRRIDIIYRRGVLADYSRDPVRADAVIRACRDGNVCMVNPFSAKLGDNKNLLAVMTDDRMSPLFSLKERKILRQYLPWTRVLRDGRTLFDGQDIDIVPYITANKDRFVVKPNNEYGGKGVVIGTDATQQQWEQAIEERITKAKVVQEYVPICVDEFPDFSDGLTFVPKKFNINFLTFRGRYGGGFCRASDSSVINISAGGALVVLLEVQESTAS